MPFQVIHVINVQNFEITQNTEYELGVLLHVYNFSILEVDWRMKNLGIFNKLERCRSFWLYESSFLKIKEIKDMLSIKITTNQSISG